MKTLNLGKSNFSVPKIAVSCANLNNLDKRNAEMFLSGALELGVNFFEHSDIYGRGSCEERFADAAHMSASVREKYIIQTKYGVIPGVMYDLSAKHIINSVEQSLKRLRTEYIDVLVFANPDPLMEPDEIARACDSLFSDGKVRNFGIANFNWMQTRLLRMSLNQPILVSQLQISLSPNSINSLHSPQLDLSVDNQGNLLDYCRLHTITPQVVLPYQTLLNHGRMPGDEHYFQFEHALEKFSQKYRISKPAVIVAWMLRHPANVQQITTTLNLGNLREISKAVDIEMSRDDWFELYRAAGYTIR